VEKSMTIQLESKKTESDRLRQLTVLQSICGKYRNALTPTDVFLSEKHNDIESW